MSNDATNVFQPVFARRRYKVRYTGDASKDMHFS